VAKGGLLVSVFSPPSREQAKAHGVRAMFFVVRPVIEAVFPLSEARQAFERGLGGHTRGKIILRVVG